MIALKIDFDDSDILTLTKELSPGRVLDAVRRAIYKTALWVRTHLASELKEEDLPRKLIVSRVQLYRQNWRKGPGAGGEGRAVKVWFGIDPVKADLIATPIKVDRGYRVQKWEFPGGFVPTLNERFKGKLYQRTTSRRLPFQRARVEVNEQATRAFNAIIDQVPGRLKTVALQELNYELQKVLGHAR